MAPALTLIQPQGELWEKIRVELNENIKTRENYLAILKEWMRQQPHLPDEWEDRCLMNFLRASSFSLEKAKKKLDMYFTMRNACPEFFTDRDVNRPELQDLAKRAYGPTLPGLTPNGRRVTICRAIDKTLSTDHLNNVFKLALMVGDVRLREEIEGVAGDVYVLDASIVMPSHMAKISPSAVKKFLICVQESYPVKLKEVHILNASPIVDTIFNLVKPFLKEKLRQRVIFHSDFSTLHNYVPKDMLPEEYGGTGPSLEIYNQAWMKKLESYVDWFKEQEQIKANEALRPGKPKDYDEMFGIDGSFRQLSID